VLDMIHHPIYLHHPIYRGINVRDTHQERRKGCSCIGVLVTLIIIVSLILVILILDSDVFFLFQEVRESAFNDLLSIVVLLILLLPIVAIVTWFLNRERPIPEDM